MPGLPGPEPRAQPEGQVRTTSPTPPATCPPLQKRARRRGPDHGRRRCRTRRTNLAFLRPYIARPDGGDRPPQPGRRLLRRRRPLRARPAGRDRASSNSPAAATNFTFTAPSAARRLQRLRRLRQHATTTSSAAARAAPPRRRRQQPVLRRRRRLLGPPNGAPATPADCDAAQTWCPGHEADRRSSAAGLLLAALLIALPAIGSNGDGGTYKVRGHTSTTAPSSCPARRSGSPARRSARSSRSTSPATTRSPATRAGPHAVPGKAVVVMKIDDSGFKDFRTDASCLIRPQSLIGEKYVDCTPDPAARRGHAAAAAAPADPRRPARRGPVPAAAGEQRQDRRPRPDPEHPAAALPRPLPPDPQRASAPGSPARGQDLGEVIDRANPALRQTDRVLEHPRPAEPAAREPGEQRRRGAGAAGPQPDRTSPASSTTPRSRARRPPSAAPPSRRACSKFPATLHQVRLTMTKLKSSPIRGRRSSPT